MKIVKRFNRSTLALGISSVLTLGLMQPAEAVSFNLGDIEGTFESQRWSPWIT